MPFVVLNLFDFQITSLISLPFVASAVWVASNTILPSDNVTLTFFTFLVISNCVFGLSTKPKSRFGNVHSLVSSFLPMASVVPLEAYSTLASILWPL